MIVNGLPDALVKATRTAAELREFARSLVKPGVMLAKVVDKIEQKANQLGVVLAFPPQLSFDSTAAHNYPSIDDATVLSSQVIKIDIGVSVDGYIGDTACTVDLSGRNEKLIQASEAALASAISIIKPGVTLSEIGKAIEKAIADYGYNPVRNLSGHGLGLYEIHTDPQIPNYDNGDNKRKLLENELIAIEPFATTGHGLVKERGNAELFQFVKKALVRLNSVRKLQSYIIERYGRLVFARRWLLKHFSRAEVELGLRMLLKLKSITAFSPLVEVKNGLVSQAEHTVLVREKPIVLTELKRT